MFFLIAPVLKLRNFERTNAEPFPGFTLEINYFPNSIILEIVKPVLKSFTEIIQSPPQLYALT